MKYKLIKPMNPNYNAIEQILVNRRDSLSRYSTQTNSIACGKQITRYGIYSMVPASLMEAVSHTVSAICSGNLLPMPIAVSSSPSQAHSFASDTKQYCYH